MAKTPGKISAGMQEKSKSLIAGEEILFGQAVEYDGSTDGEGNRYDSGNIAGVAVYDPSAGTDSSRRYEQYDPVEVLEEGVIKVRINQKFTSDDCVGETYLGYLTAGDPIYAVPEGYMNDGRAYFAADPSTFTDTAGKVMGGSGLGSGYFGPSVGTIRESTTNGDDKAVVEIELNLPVNN